MIYFLSVLEKNHDKSSILNKRNLLISRAWGTWSTNSMQVVGTRCIGFTNEGTSRSDIHNGDTRTGMGIASWREPESPVFIPFRNCAGLPIYLVWLGPHRETWYIKSSERTARRFHLELNTLYNFPTYFI